MDIPDKSNTGRAMDDVAKQEMADIDPFMELLPLEEYVTRFSNRYKDEDAFREIVHDFLGLSGVNLLKLAVGKNLFRSWYRRETDKMVRGYAVETRVNLEDALMLRRELLELERAEQELLDNTRGVRGATDAFENANIAYQESVEDKDREVRGVEQDFLEKKSSVEGEIAGQKREADSKTNARNIAKEKLQTFMESSSFISNRSGQLQFDEQQIVRSLEDIFLKEIVEGIEKGGRSGFMSKLKTSFDDLIAYWDDMDELSELSNVDWVQSAIYSRTKGYRLPTFPYLIVGKTNSQMQGKTSIDTAISLDVSGSMEANNRFEIAQKTVLALHALMRKLNPANNTYLSVFNGYRVRPITTVQLMKDIRPDGGTPTHDALNWLIEVLYDKGPSLAYLATDGEPDNVDSAIRAAEKFKDYPNIMLRLFLIDGSYRTNEITKEIGMAAGRDTKVIPISNYQLSGGLIMDVADAIGGMYDICDF